MNRMLHYFLCAALFAVAAPSFAETGDSPPDGSFYRITSLFPGGDVLRPGPADDGYKWYIGIDLGLTYSSFSGGPLNFFTPITGPAEVEGTMQSTVDGGSGLGFYVGLAADFPVSDAVGIVLKGNFHNRMGSFENRQMVENMYIAENDEFTDVTFRDEVDWSFRYFGFDILARIQLMEESLYLLAGPSFGILLGNTAEATQWLAAPDDVFYRETDGFTDNEIRSVWGEEEIDGFESIRVDLKFGVGTWIELTDKLFLTPELTLAYPLAGMVTSSFTDFRPTDFSAGDSKVHSRPVALSDLQAPTTFLNTNPDFNMITIFFTVGLRWQMD